MPVCISSIFVIDVMFEGSKEGNSLFNDTQHILFTVIWHQTYCKGPDSDRGNPLPPHRLLFPISSKGSFICPIQDNTYQPLLHQL